MLDTNPMFMGKSESARLHNAKERLKTTYPKGKVLFEGPHSYSVAERDEHGLHVAQVFVCDRRGHTGTSLDSLTQIYLSNAELEVLTGLCASE